MAHLKKKKKVNAQTYTQTHSSGRPYSSVVITVPTILRPWVQIPSTASMVFSIYIVEIETVFVI